MSGELWFWVQPHCSQCHWIGTEEEGISSDSIGRMLQQLVEHKEKEHT